MSTVAHTPGPWLKRYYDRVTRHDDIDGSKSIAHVYGVKGRPDEQTANRNLIAAAPDLLAACKDCMENRGDWGAVMAAAIAKAEGRS